jgi:TPR repeat protein
LDETEAAKARAEYAEISFELGEYYEKREKNVDDAINYYNEALRMDETNSRAMLNLAKIHLSRSEYDQCERVLGVLLRTTCTA